MWGRELWKFHQVIKMKRFYSLVIPKYRQFLTPLNRDKKCLGLQQHWIISTHQWLLHVFILLCSEWKYLWHLSCPWFITAYTVYTLDHRKGHLGLTEKRANHPDILDIQQDVVTGLSFGLSCLGLRGGRGVDAFHMCEDGQNEYLVTRRIHIRRGWLSVHKLGSSSWEHS